MNEQEKKNAQMDKIEIQNFLKGKQSRPVVFAYSENGNVSCFAGSFGLDELCLMKEVINRKIDTMLDQAIKMNVNVNTKMPELKQINGEKV